MSVKANWNYPTSIRFGAGPHRRTAGGAEERRHHAAAAGHRSRRRQAADVRRRRSTRLRAAGLAAAAFSDVQAQPGRKQRRRRPRGLPRRRPRRRHRLRRRLGARRRQGHRLHGRPDAADVGLRGHRRLVDARRPERHRADHRRADHRGHRLGSRPRRRHHRRGDPHQEDHLPSEDDAGDRDLRSRADGRPAARSDGGDGHGRAGALPGGLLRAGLPPDGRRHRASRAMRLVKENLPRAVARRRPTSRRAAT